MPNSFSVQLCIIPYLSVQNKAISNSKNHISKVQNLKEQNIEVKHSRESSGIGAKEISQMEYNLLKLESMKKNKIVTEDEYKRLRRKILNFKKNEKIFEESQKEYWFYFVCFL